MALLHLLPLIYLLHSKNRWQMNALTNTFLMRMSWHRIASALLALCERNTLVTSGLPVQRPVKQSFDVSFLVSLNKLLNKQWNCWWFEMPWRSYVTSVREFDRYARREISIDIENFFMSWGHHSKYFNWTVWLIKIDLCEPVMDIQDCLGGLQSVCRPSMCGGVSVVNYWYDILKFHIRGVVIASTCSCIHGDAISFGDTNLCQYWLR